MQFWIEKNTKITNELVKIWMEVVVANFPGRPKPVINWTLPEQMQC